ncbi:hypothetical protein Q5P01_000672 [Channa striata]|uniref:Uncharacterized protein n=1 Tax=Channa striata TaxID=64152 RepID=A0AA88LER5_CHASR|nr:hypothetical protein Q5P01_000672 [Channa striata]
MVERGASSTGRRAPEPPPLRRVRSARDERRRCAEEREPGPLGPLVRLRDKARTERARSPRWTATPSAAHRAPGGPAASPQTDRRLSHRSETGPCSQTPPSGYAETQAVPGAGAVQAVGRVGRGFRLRTPTRARFDVVRRDIRGADASSTRVYTGDGLSLYECVSSWKTDTCLVFDQGCRGEIPRTLCALAMGDERLGVDFTLRCVLPDGGEDLDLRDLVPLDPGPLSKRRAPPVAELPSGPEAGARGANAPTGTRLSPGFHALREMIRLPSAFSVLAENENVLVLRHLLRDAVAIAPGQGPRRGGGRRRGPRKEGRGAEGPRRVRWGTDGMVPRGHSGAQNRAARERAAAAGVVVEPPRRVHARGLWRGRSTAECPRCTHTQESGVPRRGRARGPQDEQTHLRSIGRVRSPHDGRIALPS